MTEETLSVIGCGTMGFAVLSGVLDSRAEAKSNASETTEGADLLPGNFIATVQRPQSAKNLQKKLEDAGHNSVEILLQGNVEAARRGDYVILGSKPQMVADILAEEGMVEALKGKVLISLCAGLRVDKLKSMVDPSTRVVRAMPNTPCRIREGMTVLSPLGSDSSEHEQNVLQAIFSAVGRCHFLHEKHFDAVTALAGSGPAFYTLFLEAMADGGVMMGLPRPEALELAAQTMQGAARMVLQTGMHPAALKDSVTTPGGCTIAGLLQLEDGKVRSTVARTVQAAAEHAAGLGGPK
ncbi:pyrroline-5-carboxylate reductase [Malassezia cuniculi]|uniref:Pyrroline-5-carboxylate reductase n=1 Tax=Malassezia cuniculi TaxID=948313 RepID=A0AAF0ERZ7_9BASI|nr:pyrroline-5-carboxylate reductase [Malassezia cuniculi]